MQNIVSLLATISLLAVGNQSAWAQPVVREYVQNGVEVVEEIISPNFRSLSLTALRDSTRLSTSYWNDGAKEQFADAAWIVRHGFIPMVFVVKDANEVCMVFDYLKLYRRVGGTRTLLYADEADTTISSDQHYIFGGFGTGDIGPPVPTVGDTILFEWELRFRDCGCPFGSCWKVSRYFNRVTVGQPLPNLTNWFRTDTHYHTRFTDNIFEFGGFMWMVRQSAEAIDLDVVCLTDHSTDIKTTLNEFGWSQLLAEADSLSDGTVLLIPGEELTLDSDEMNQAPGQENRVHQVVFGLTRPLLAPEECCSQNSSGLLWTVRQGMDSVAVQNAVAMAAHPSRTFSVGYGGSLTKWSDTNFDIAATYPQFIGSEFYNERRTVLNNPVENDDHLYPFDWTSNPNWEDVWNEGLRDFYRLVQRYLNPTPRKFFLAGGSDAHGDFDNKYTNQYGITSKVANDDAIGKVFTLVYSPSGLNQVGILDGMRQGAMVMSDGPAFTVWVDADGNGASDGTVGGSYAFESDATVRLQGSCLIGEHGQFTLARMIHLTPSAVETTTVNLSGTPINLTLPAGQYAAPGAWSALIVQVRTQNGYQAVGSPIYIAPQGTTDVGGSVPTALALSAPWPNPASQTVRLGLLFPTTTTAQLQILDIAGRVVMTQELGTVGPGPATFTWDGTDQQGSRVPTGLYFVHLITPEAGRQQKVVIVR